MGLILGRPVRLKSILQVALSGLGPLHLNLLVQLLDLILFQGQLDRQRLFLLLRLQKLPGKLGELSLEILLCKGQFLLQNQGFPRILVMAHGCLARRFQVGTDSGT